MYISKDLLSSFSVARLQTVERYLKNSVKDERALTRKITEFKKRKVSSNNASSYKIGRIAFKKMFNSLIMCSQLNKQLYLRELFSFITPFFYLC